MKIAILTIHHVPNYGAVMQAYSLKKTVQQLGFDCDVVNYQPTTATDFYKKTKGKFPKSLVTSIRHKRIQRFVNRFILSRNAPALKSSEAVFDCLADYDCVICGSDQIWNADGFRGLDKTFFLGNLNLRSTKKISYAPSIGSADPSKYVSDWSICGKWLKEFDAISVRDENSKSMVESFGLPSPELVCDPTLLPSALSDLSSRQKGSQEYLVLYGAPALHVDQIREMADRHKLKIVCAGGRRKFADKNYLFADPKNWAALFSQSKIVVTGMFHGVQLAILNNALPFYIGSPEKKAKVLDSLTRYGLEKQWVDGPDSLTAENVDAGFARMDHVCRLRDKVASSSLAWLESQLS